MPFDRGRILPTAHLMENDISLKLNFEGELTLDVLQDVLRATQQLADRSRLILNKAYDLNIEPSKVSITKIEAGSFIGDICAYGKKHLPNIIQIMADKDVSMGKAMLISFTMLSLVGIGCYTFLQVTAAATGATTVSDSNGCIVGNNNQGNTINYNINNGPDMETIIAELERRFPQDKELCRHIAQHADVGITDKGKKEAMQAIVRLKSPGGNKVTSIVLTSQDGENNALQTIIKDEEMVDVPANYEQEAPRTERAFIKDIHIDIIKMNMENSAEGSWGAKVEDIETGLPNRTLPLIIDNEILAKEVRQKMAKPFAVDMWAEFQRDKKGNPKYLRYILKEVK